ncbi:hypothetical protein Trco_005534 [Trichoderma cornu-damae]|uniref:Uncharacterized protein n=1 Tax=Trichoderma cornu-damae TaxID=654480 RepID=A0A9P8TSP0_9HYPO|nr:hypothetical protein Trco_005534 [Trichoderma cornu-damae]
MSLSRAFTTRKLRLSSDSGDARGPQRSNTLRHKISAPVQLVHTTNMLSYNAPDLPRPGRTGSARSLDDSDSFATAESTPPTSPDAAPGERTPSPKPNHLSGYFRGSAKPVAPAEPEPAPVIPQRSPTHTKKNSVDAVARSRSISRISRDSELSAASKSLQAFSRTPSVSTRSSAHSSSVSGRSVKQPLAPAAPIPKAPAPKAPAPKAPALKAPAPMAPTVPPAAPAPLSVQPPIAAQHHASKDSHPFGPELAQVTELAEEYSSGSQLELADEDVEYIRAKGLVRLRPDDYLSMMQGLSSLFFSPEPSHPAPTTAAPLWI